jgi:hypothetical protein
VFLLVDPRLVRRHLEAQAFDPDGRRGCQKDVLLPNRVLSLLQTTLGRNLSGIGLVRGNRAFGPFERRERAVDFQFPAASREPDDANPLALNPQLPLVVSKPEAR